jgi:sialate O-acetylesterase
MNNRTVSRCLALFLLLAAAGFCRAEVHLPAIFGDHMVLQEKATLPVWGTAEAGEAVTVTLGDQTGKATADAAGQWRIDLKPVAPAGPLTMTVAGKNTVTFSDILVGDVWVCSGQSNMEFNLGGGKFGFGGAHNAETELPKADHPQLRLFVVGKKIALAPETDVQGKWVVCSPETAGYFSAVGYFFGRDLQEHLQKPIGLIGTYWGGMPAQAFTSLSGLQKEPALAHYVDAIEKEVAAYPKAKADYPAALATWQEQKKQWDAANGAAFAEAQKQWTEAVDAAKKNNQPPPPKFAFSPPPPKGPPKPEGEPSAPTVLFNGMIAPLIPYAIKGAIWYQGESNSGAAKEYQTLFPRMITDWREKWGEGDFPFLFVQLANFTAPQKHPSEGGWAYLREAQTMTLALPHTGMAVTIDIGNGADIHPRDKEDVGQRLALAARHVAYGEDLVYSGPIYDAMKVEGNAIRVSFKDTGTGLKMAAAPWSPAGVPTAPSELTGFAIAGADQQWSWAKARIDGKDVIVSSDEVGSPVAVRYGWANNPPCDLYNNEGLPASPFRTDDWADKPQIPKPAPPPLPTPPVPPAPPHP